MSEHKPNTRYHNGARDNGARDNGARADHAAVSRTWRRDIADALFNDNDRTVLLEAVASGSRCARPPPHLGCTTRPCTRAAVGISRSPNNSKPHSPPPALPGIAAAPRSGTATADGTGTAAAPTIAPAPKPPGRPKRQRNRQAELLGRIDAAQPTELVFRGRGFCGFLGDTAIVGQCV